MKENVSKKAIRPRPTSKIVSKPINQKKKRKPRPVVLSHIENSSNDEADLAEDQEGPPIELKKDFGRVDLKQGVFILVDFSNNHVKSRKASSYRYVCMVQCPPEEDEDGDDDELSVMSLRCLDSTKKQFCTAESDISFMKLDQVIGILPEPGLIQRGERIRYIFHKSVDVFEK